MNGRNIRKRLMRGRTGRSGAARAYVRVIVPIAIIPDTYPPPGSDRYAWRRMWFEDGAWDGPPRPPHFFFDALGEALFWARSGGFEVADYGAERVVVCTFGVKWRHPYTTAAFLTELHRALRVCEAQGVRYRVRSGLPCVHHTQTLGLSDP